MEDTKLWRLGDGKHDKSEVTKLFTNYDFHSILHYDKETGITAHNDYYNQVGFGVRSDLTATDRIALNLLHSCHEVKNNIYKEFLNEETDRAYIELGQLSINLNDESQR